MRIHTDTLTARDIYDAADRAGDAVSVTFTQHGSRSRARAFNVTLTGSSSRRPNSGGYGAGGYGDTYAATWDEWGMFLAELFRRDPAMIAGSPGRPVYADAEHFHWTTGGRFHALTPAYQHGKAGHRWEYQGPSASGNYSISACTSCTATTRRADLATYRAFIAEEV